MSVSATLTPGAGMLTVAGLSGTGGTPTAVTDGGGGADMRRAFQALAGSLATAQSWVFSSRGIASHPLSGTAG